MALVIKHNKALHTHENEQFRRVATQLIQIFSEKGWSGLLIGNPFNERYARFRADAILFFNYGLIIIDFKDYRGTVKFPPNEDEFFITKWFTESEKDKVKVEIKAGAKFINPFRQLKYYRESFYEIIENNLLLNGFVDPSHVCALNICKHSLNPVF
jgi:hypothetical protein